MTDIEELADTLSCYSDAARLGDSRLSLSHSTASSQARLTDIASAVTARALATFNLHPAPWKFRQLSKPPSFDAIRKRLENQALLRHTLSKTTSSILGVDQYATDSLAFVRRIIPGGFPQLASFVAPATALAQAQAPADSSDELLPMQAPSILEDDDIAEFSDVDDADDWTAVAASKKRPTARLSLELALSGSDATQATVATSPASSMESPLQPC
jgi:hypothetical protein